ncbi:MAG: electron transfer flavoprotein subunit alpha/FixB family protein [Chitinophagales bacterium]
MSVLVYIDHANGSVKKSSLEALSYAKAVADQLGGKDVVGVALGDINNATLADLGNYGATKVLHASDSLFNSFDATAYTKVLAEAAQGVGAEVVVLLHNSTGKSIAPRLSVRLKAGLVAGAIELPNLSSGFVVRKSVFSGKGFANYSIDTATKIISVNPNAFAISKNGGGNANVEAFSSSVSAADFKVKVLGRSEESDTIPLPEAELVVSAGRGLKGPQNWGMVEELATLLGAATACSRPVADVGWRPHHEHVGQTGITVSPNLYIAIGISGAIQHLAGVNNSKVIVVINTDPEAPFFKAADYGIVGDAFDVVPKLITAIRSLKS